jgi:hypothetical protein
MTLDMLTQLGGSGARDNDRVFLHSDNIFVFSQCGNIPGERFRLSFAKYNLVVHETEYW